MPPIAAAATARVVTPTAANNRQRRSAKPPRNRLEISPNNRATCGACGVKIQKGLQRASILEKRNDYFGGCKKIFYHYECLREEQRAKLPSPEKQAEQDLMDERVSREPPELKDKLRRLRRKLQQEHYYQEAYQVFPNDTLDQLVLSKPTTPQALQKVKGIGPKRFDLYGKEILQLMRQHHDENIAAIRLDLEEAAAATIPAAATSGIKIEQDDDGIRVFDDVLPPTRQQKEIKDMKPKEIRKELEENYGINTKCFVEKEDYVKALQKARRQKKNNKDIKDMTPKEIRKELEEEHKVETRGLREKREYVRALEKARVRAAAAAARNNDEEERNRGYL